MYRQEAAFLRGNDTIELYDTSQYKLTFVAKYEMVNGKCLEMRSIRLTWKPHKDVLLLYMPHDKVSRNLPLMVVDRDARV